MLELPHAVVGATIAVLIPNPAIAIPLALASHFAMDLYPHWNPHIDREIKRYGHLSIPTSLFLWADSGTALVIGFALANHVLPNITQSSNILLCCFMAVFPDVVEIPLVLFHQKWPWLKKYADLLSQFQFRLPAPAGVYTQLLVLVICAVIISRNI
jgi:hypothetical protein